MQTGLGVHNPYQPTLSALGRWNRIPNNTSKSGLTGYFSSMFNTPPAGYVNTSPSTSTSTSTTTSMKKDHNPPGLGQQGQPGHSNPNPKRSFTSKRDMPPLKIGKFSGNSHLDDFVFDSDRDILYCVSKSEEYPQSLVSAFQVPSHNNNNDNDNGSNGASGADDGYGSSSRDNNSNNNNKSNTQWSAFTNIAEDAVKFAHDHSIRLPSSTDSTYSTSFTDSSGSGNGDGDGNNNPTSTSAYASVHVVQIFPVSEGESGTDDTDDTDNTDNSYASVYDGCSDTESDAFTSERERERQRDSAGAGPNSNRGYSAVAVLSDGSRAYVNVNMYE